MQSMLALHQVHILGYGFLASSHKWTTTYGKIPIVYDGLYIFGDIMVESLALGMFLLNYQNSCF